MERIVSVTFTFNDAVLTMNYIGRGKMFVVKAGPDEYLVFDKESLESDILARIFTDILFRCVSGRDLVKYLNNTYKYLVIPRKMLESSKPPSGFFRNLKKAGVLKLVEVCEVSREELERYRKELAEALGTREIVEQYSLEEMLSLYLAKITPEKIIREANDIRRFSKDLAEETLLVDKKECILNAIDEILSSLGVVEVAVYVAEEISLPVFPDNVSVVFLREGEPIELAIELSSGKVKVVEDSAVDPLLYMVNDAL